MAPYQVIARRFRPQSFSEMVEQVAIVQTLKNAIRLKRVGHAYLFCGTRGTGKTSVARLFAKALNCSHGGPDQEPCNKCLSCVEIAAGYSLDVIEIDGASNRGVDDIRSLNETVHYTPFHGLYKIYLIDEVHMLTKEAFNALLKTLEEPPAHVIFLFATTEPHKILTTILSRCQRFDLRPLTPEGIQRKLSAIVHTLGATVEEGALQLLASHADGSLRDAESLLDQLLCYEEPPITREHAIRALGLVPETFFFQLDEAVKGRNYGAVFALSEAICQTGCHLHHFLESLVFHFRTIALVHTGAKHPTPEYVRAAQQYTQPHVLEVLGYLVDVLEKGQRVPLTRLQLEVVFLHIIQGSQKIALESLVERLERLQQELSSPPQASPSPSPSPSPHIGQHVVPPPSSPATVQQKIRHDQVMQFAAVELQGVLKKG